MAYPKIFDSNNIELATLNNITSNSLKRRVNSFYEFNFQCYEEEFKTEYIQFENYIQTDDETFDIAYINESDVNNSPYYDVKCEHVFYRLHDDATKKNNYALSGTPTEILTDLLSGTDFTVGTVDFTSNIVYAVNREATVMNIVISLANTLGAEIGFSNNGFTVDLLNTIGQDNGVEVRIKKNIKGISKSIDKRGVDKTSYKIDLVDVHNSEEYKDLTMIETLDIGDTFQLIDETLGINISQSVLEIEKDVIKESITNITTSNNFDLLDDKLSYIEETAVKKDEIIYGIKINEDVGLEIERDDKLARTKLNADEFRMQTGDGSGGYTDALYFDPINKEYIYVGKITVTSGSGIGNFTDAGNLATLDTITTTEITDDAVTTPKIFANAVTTDKVAADAITADKILANAVTADKISVNKLSAIDADLGNITAGTITGVTAEFGGSGKVVITPSANGSVQFKDNLENLIGKIESSSLFSSLDISTESGVRLDFSASNADVKIQTAYSGDIIIAASDAVEIQPYGGVAKYRGYEIVNNAGNGLDKNNSTLSIDPSEIAGNGLQEDNSENLEVDFSDVPFSNGQSIEFQIVGGNLEYRLSGGSFTALANY